MGTEENLLRRIRRWQWEIRGEEETGEADTLMLFGGQKLSQDKYNQLTLVTSPEGGSTPSIENMNGRSVSLVV